MLAILTDGRRAVIITSSSIPGYISPRMSYLGAVTVISGSRPITSGPYRGTDVSELSNVTPIMTRMSTSVVILINI